MGDLGKVARRDRASGSGAALTDARARGLDAVGGRIRVVVETSDVLAARAAVGAGGGEIGGSAGHLLEALVPPRSLEAWADADGVERVRRPALHVADVVGEGVSTINAPVWPAAGHDGTGVRVAIVDLGFDGYASRLGTELPATVTTQNYCADFAATEHGTGVAEIVHEVAPAAQLYLICIEDEVDLANAVAYAKAQGIRVIDHSVSWFNTSRGDGDGGPGTPDAIVADARANGIFWVNSAGNRGTTHWGGPFNDFDGDDVHAISLQLRRPDGRRQDEARSQRSGRHLERDVRPRRMLPGPRLHRHFRFGTPCRRCRGAASAAAAGVLPAEIQALLEARAVDADVAGKDNGYGAGQLHLPPLMSEGRIVYQSDRSGSQQILRTEPTLDGVNDIGLTQGPGNNVQPSVSPDGTKIAFASDRDGNYEIYVMDVDGSNPVRLLDRPSSSDLHPNGRPTVRSLRSAARAAPISTSTSWPRTERAPSRT